MTSDGPDHSIEQFEVVGPITRPANRRSRRYVAVLGVAAVAGAAVGAGMWAWQAWTDQGAQPSQALPANTLAYAALDLDPPGQQKVAAYQTLRKFPSLKKDLGLDSADDLSNSVLEEITSESTCDLDYADLKPWVGDRVAFAVVPQDQPEPVLVVQVDDAAKARAGLKAAGRACKADEFGYAVDGEWAVLARNDEVAARVRDDAQRRSLDHDAGFQSLTKAAGDPGLVTLYAAPAAGKALLDAIEHDPFLAFTVTSFASQALDPISSIISIFAFSTVAMHSYGEDTATSFDDGEIGSDALIHQTPEMRKAQRKLARRMAHFDELTDAEQQQLIREQKKLAQQMYPSDADHGSFSEGDVPEGSFDDLESTEGFAFNEVDPALKRSLEDFTGLGGVARFADGGLEVEVSGDSLGGLGGDAYAGRAGDEIVSDLPADTAIAFGAGWADDWVSSLLGRMGALPFSGSPADDATAAFEKVTGLDVPADLEALGGDAISVVAGSGISPERFFEDPAHAPVAVRIRGDADRIEAALDKLRNGIGAEGASKLLSRRVGEDVVVGPDAGYLDDLAKAGDGLGDSERFRKVAPEAGDATTVLYVDFDAGDWLAKGTDGDDRKDAEPLDSMGMTVTKDGDHQRVLLRVSFD